MNISEQVVSQIVAEIIEDMTDRRGFRQEWENIEEDIQTEIIMTWENIISQAIARASTESESHE